MRSRASALLSVLLLSVVALGADAPKTTSCINCHGNTELFDQEHVAVVKSFGQDVHAEVGLSCHDCHGGNPDPQLSDDMPGAMDEGFKTNPYRGQIQRTAIPEFCARCHSSPAFMRRFRADIRVDQLAEYRTSHHGKALARGDTSVATCTDCHGVHGILRPTNPQAPVYSTRVAETCSRCHSDPARMSTHRDATGHPLPVDQFAKWRNSVHAAAMFDKGDLSAPTCNDCHGNHGAAPPGVNSVAFVCGHCHGREAELFRASAKQAAFAGHNDLIADGSDCSTCHDNLPPQAHVRRFEECVTCHENHGVIRPTVALLGSLPDTPCAFCHEGISPLAQQLLEPGKKAQNYRQVRETLLASAATQMLEGEGRFNWLVDQALVLPTHTLQRETGERPVLRPEFSRLFEKFRIGKTEYSYTDPVTNKQTAVKVRQCTDCHQDAQAKGLPASRNILAKIREGTVLTARAERTLLAAQRGGVEVRQARSELDQAVDSQIELEVLVHTFTADGLFDEKYQEGLQHAKASMEAGHKALAELRFRRQGLLVALGFVALTLVGLALKIRALDRRS